MSDIFLLAEREILIVVASLVVHCCAIKNVIVASQLYDVADVGYSSQKKKKAPLNFCSLAYSKV